jgi:hypothetical protein
VQVQHCSRALLIHHSHLQQVMLMWQHPVAAAAVLPGDPAPVPPPVSGRCYCCWPLFLNLLPLLLSVLGLTACWLHLLVVTPLVLWVLLLLLQPGLLPSSLGAPP